MSKKQKILKIVLSCILTSICLGAAKKGKKSPIQLAQEPQNIEQFLKAYPDIAQYTGGFLPYWKFQSTIQIPLPLSVQDHFSFWLSADGNLLVTRTKFDDYVTIFETTSGKLLKEVILPDLAGAMQMDCIFNTAGTLLIVKSILRLYIIPISIGKKSISIADPIAVTKTASFIAFNPTDESELLCASETEPLQVRNSATGEPIRSFANGSQSRNSFALSPDGTHIALRNDRSDISIWDIASGIRVLQLHVPNALLHTYYRVSYMYPLLYISYSNILLGEMAGAWHNAGIYNTKTGQLIGHFNLKADVLSKCFLLKKQNQCIMLEHEKERVVLLDFNSGKYSYLHLSQNFSALSATKETSVAALGESPRTIYLLDMATNKLMQTLMIPKDKDQFGKINKLQFSDDGNILAAGSSSSPGQLYIWRQTSYSEPIKEKIARQEAQPLLQFLRDLRLIALMARL